MKTRHLCVSLLFLGAVVTALAIAHTLPASVPVHERTFDITYTAEVHNVPTGTKDVQIWLPYPQSDEYQKILKANVSAPYPTKIVKGAEYGNQIVHIEVKDLKAASIPVTMTFTVRRSEHLHNDFTQVSGKKSAPTADMKRWLEPDKLVPLDERIRELSAEVTQGKTTDLEKARAIYDYVLANMKYDKSGTGWGNGDIYWACDAKRGNCTDFHALFIGLARSAGIPAKFEIGLPVPADKSSGEIGGYHCWAEFYFERVWMGAGGRVRSVEGSGEARIFFWGARCESSAVQRGTRYYADSCAGGAGAELFYLSVCGGGRQAVQAGDEEIQLQRRESYAGGRECDEVGTLCLWSRADCAAPEQAQPITSIAILDAF